MDAGGDAHILSRRNNRPRNISAGTDNEIGLKFPDDPAAILLGLYVKPNSLEILRRKAAAEPLNFNGAERKPCFFHQGFFDLALIADKMLLEGA